MVVAPLPPIVKPTGGGAAGGAAGAAVVSTTTLNAQTAMKAQIAIQARIAAQQQIARQQATQALFGINRGVQATRIVPGAVGTNPGRVPLGPVVKTTSHQTKLPHNPLLYGYTNNGRKIVYNTVTKNFETVLASVVKPTVPLDTFRFAFNGIRQQTYADAVKYGGAP